METHSNIRRIDRIYVKYYFYSLKQRTVPLFPTVIAVRKRAGFMLERAGVSSEELCRLKSSIGRDNSYAPFNPFIKSRKGAVNQDWKVILNG